MSDPAYYLMLVLLFSLGVMLDRFLSSRNKKRRSGPCSCSMQRGDPEPDALEFETRVQKACFKACQSRTATDQCEYLILLIEANQRSNYQRGCLCLAGHDNLIRVAEDLKNVIDGEYAPVVEVETGGGNHPCTWCSHMRPCLTKGFKCNSDYCPDEAEESGSCEGFTEK